MINDSHPKRSQIFAIDAMNADSMNTGYGSFNPAVDFIPKHGGPQIKVAINGKKNKKFNFPNCEVGQWYNLTICQEEINEKKFKFTATLTELPDEGDIETEGGLKSIY